MSRKVTCPHCSEVNVLKGKVHELNHGNPILTCRKCKAEFLSKRCREVALTKPYFNDLLPIGWEIWLVLLLGVGNLYSCFGGEKIDIDIGNILSGVFATAIGLLAVYGSLKGYPRRLRYLKEEKVRSAQRCADPAYVEKLISMGYKFKCKK